MKRARPTRKTRQIVERIVGENPSLASVAPLFLYQGDELFKLEVLASVLNDVPPDSPAHSLVGLIERLVTSATAKQEWVKQASPVIGPIPCTPVPGSPLYVLNKFLETNPCILRVEGLERANGKVAVHATHIPLPVVAGMSRNVDAILWVLWEVFYRDIDLSRLKDCPVCHRWFVDHSKNKSKVRCSARCTWRRWSWKARKNAGHKLPRKSAKTQKGKSR
jgi:hypothetical protein